MTTEPFLALSGLRRAFGATLALGGADLAIEAGSIHALVGENGAGKSTLIKCLSGLYQPDDGEIRLDGRAATIADPRHAEALGFRFIHQELNLVPHFDAVGNAWIGRRHPKHGPFLDRRRMRREVASIAARIAPELPLDVAAVRLTPGQRQMAEIVRALMSPARLVVMDEPTSSLSEGEAERLHAVVRQLAAEGCSVLFISHRLDEVMALCGRYTVLRNGRTVGSGAIADIDRAGLVRLMSGGSSSGSSASPALPSPNLPHKGEGILPSSSTDGKDRLDAPSPPLWGRVGEGGTGAGAGNRPRLTAEIAFGSPGRTIAIAAYPGEIIGLYGLVGSGRSSLLRMIWGATAASGAIRLDAKKLKGGPASRIAAGIVYVPEDRRREGLAMALSIEANLALPYLADYRRRKALPSPSPSRIRTFAAEAGRRLKLTAGGFDHSPRTLSGGNQQKLLFGRWLGRPIRALLADEPTRGVDIGAKAEIHAEIGRLAAAGASVLMATSDIEELLAMSHRILVLSAGTLVAELSGPSLTRDAVVAAAFGHAPLELAPAAAAHPDFSP